MIVSLPVLHFGTSFVYFVYFVVPLNRSGLASNPAPPQPHVGRARLRSSPNPRRDQVSPASTGVPPSPQGRRPVLAFGHGIPLRQLLGRGPDPLPQRPGPHHRRMRPPVQHPPLDLGNKTKAFFDRRCTQMDADVLSVFICVHLWFNFRGSGEAGRRRGLAREWAGGFGNMHSLMADPADAPSPARASRFQVGRPGRGSGDPDRSSEVREHVRADGGSRWIPGRRKMGKMIEGKTMDVIGEGAGPSVAVCRMLVCSGHGFAHHRLADSFLGPGPDGWSGSSARSGSRARHGQGEFGQRNGGKGMMP